MSNLKKEIDTLKARTPFQKTVKKVLQELYEAHRSGKVSEKNYDIQLPVEENNKPVLEEFAEKHEINISEPKNKPQYVDAINAWLEENS